MVQRYVLKPSNPVLLDEVHFALLKRGYLRDLPHVTCTLKGFLRAFAQREEVEENEIIKMRYLWINILPLSRGVAQQKYKEK